MGNEAGDDWLADLLVSKMGLEGAIHVCRVYAWDGVLKCVIPLHQGNVHHLLRGHYHTRFVLINSCPAGRDKHVRHVAIEFSEISGD